MFDPDGREPDARCRSADDVRAIAFVRDRLHAHTLVDAHGITALVWQPPAGTTSVKLAARP